MPDEPALTAGVLAFNAANESLGSTNVDADCLSFVIKITERFFSFPSVSSSLALACSLERFFRLALPLFLLSLFEWSSDKLDFYLSRRFRVFVSYLVFCVMPFMPLTT